MWQKTAPASINREGRSAFTDRKETDARRMNQPAARAVIPVRNLGTAQALEGSKREEVMHRSAIEQFDMPVRLVLRPGEPVTEVYTPAEAVAALFASPVQEGPIYESALEACFAATMDPA